MSEMNQGAENLSSSGASSEQAAGGAPEQPGTGEAGVGAGVRDGAGAAAGAAGEGGAGGAAAAAAGEGSDSGAGAAGSVDGTTRTTLDALLAGEQGPDWLTARLELGTAKQVTEEDLRNMDPTSKRVVTETIKRHEAARSELLEAARSIEEEKQVLAARERLAARREADGLRWAQNPGMKEFLQGVIASEAPLDPSSIEGIRHQARVETAQMFQEAWNKFGEVQQETAEYARLQEEAATQAEADAAEVAYIEENMATFQDPEIAEVTKGLVQNHGMDLKTAHEFALAKVNDARGSDPSQSAADRAVELSRRRIANGGTLPNAIPETPDGLSISEKNAFWEQNPGAMKRDIARKRARSGY